MITECAVKSGSPAWREQDRLAALRDYAILDTEPEIAFDDITRIAAQVCRTPVALVSLVEDRRQWFKSEFGLGVQETTLDRSICAHAIRHKGLFVVPDTTKDPRFSCNPLVTGEPHLRFYAGAVLETSEGHPLGTVCVLDTKARPRGLTPEQANTLLALARSVMRELELRRATKRLAEQSSLLHATLENMDQGILMVDANGYVAVCNERAASLLDLPSDLMRRKPHFSVVKKRQIARGEFNRTEAALRRDIESGGMECDPLLYERQRPNGTFLEIRTVRLPTGGVVRTYTDVTSRKSAEEALAQSEARYRALIETSAAIVWRAAPDGSILDGWGWESYCGQSPEAYCGHGWLHAVHPDDRSECVAIWQDLLANPRAGTNEYRVRHVSGEYRWVSARGVPLMNADGSVREWTGTITDIHDQKLAGERIRRSEQRYRALIEASAVVVWIAAPDGSMRDGLGWTELTGQSAEEYAGFGWLRVVHPEDQASITGVWTSAITSGTPCAAEMRIRSSHGGYRWVSARGVPVAGANGTIREWAGVIVDIHEQKQAAEALRASEERLQLALSAGRMVAWERDLVTHQISRSENARTLLGLGSGPASEFLERVHPDDRPIVSTFVEGAVAKGVDTAEVRYCAPGSREMWLGIRAERPAVDRIIGITFDITDRKAAEQEVWRAANHDALTGLPNRALFHERLAAALEHAEAAGTSVSLLLLDLDDFKAVNDTLGHDAGDALLKETARRLSAMVRDCDTVARLGGDEFAIILVEPMSLDSAACFAEMLIEQLRSIFEYEGRALSTKASIGVAAFPDHHREPDELMKDADIALYQAKAEGRSRAVVYTKAARDMVEQKVRVIAEVRDGLEADQFVPFYQPKVCLRTGQIVGLEALARWQHPTHGVLTPGYFHPAFSDPELAVAMGERMIRHVAGDVRSWLDQGLDCGRVAVNFSSAEFADPYLARHVLKVLAQAGVPTSHFEVEVTESVFLERSTETASAILREFSEAGVSVALDDFGTGFASLTHLKRYPVHHIKVDQSFVRDLEADRDDAAIVSAVISLGRSLGMQVTAEGVETVGQAQRLSAMGCDHAQGYLYAKPMIGSRVPWLLGTSRDGTAPEVRRTA